VTVIGIDDTDSRELGMCTTYAAARLGERIRSAGGDVERILLVRLNPAVEHKTRGNAALAVHTDIGTAKALALADGVIERAATGDARTNPGVVVTGSTSDAVPESVATFAVEAVRRKLDPRHARALCDRCGFETVTAGNGRGVVGALAAVGAWQAFEDWTYECISYRERERWGTDREVDRASVVAAADAAYPTVWDTVDRQEDVAVCVPRTPCPVLHGIRGDTPDAVTAVAERIGSEPVSSRQLFVTNQGTDVHLRPGTVEDLQDGRAYRVTGHVETPPETREGGHVFVRLSDDTGDVPCVAFEPTKRFRERVRALRVGDRITACGEVSSGTLKLEKFAVRNLVRTEQHTPECPDCGRSMESAGRDAGYRCRDCSTTAPGKVQRPIERELSAGWYEVPPVARRHIAKPLVRGGFDAPVHPER
jgi:tRNA(Ile2)-agmatinylcytidine synthase